MGYGDRLWEVVSLRNTEHHHNKRLKVRSMWSSGDKLWEVVSLRNTEHHHNKRSKVRSMWGMEIGCGRLCL